MTHDRLCPAHDPNVASQSCRCGLIARVRADEHERLRRRYHFEERVSGDLTYRGEGSDDVQG